MTEAEVAEALGIDDRHLRRIEAGAFNLTLASLLKIAGLYSVDPQRLLRPLRTADAPRKRGRPSTSSRRRRSA